MPLTASPYPTVQLYIRVTGYARVKKVISALSDRGYYRGLLKDFSTDLLEQGVAYARSITHVDTGDLASSHLWEYDSHAMKGRIYLNRRIAHARGGVVQFSWIYGAYEHDRGGTHAFYERTFNEFVLPRLPAGMRMMVQRLEML